MSATREKILLDTDIGNNVDDAVCLAYLLANPACELMGITTVSGNPVARARMCSAICKAAGQEVPILPGVAAPLLVPQRQPEVPHAAALDAWPHDTTFPDGEALSFMRDTIRNHPGAVTLLAIGPLTNLALLFAQDPELPGMLKRLVMMAGCFSNRTAGIGPGERNAISDPHAAAIVYRSDVPVHRSVGIDVTARVSMPATEVLERFKAPVLQPVLDVARVWFEQRDALVFNDPLAAATLFDDGICTFLQGRVEVELTAPRLMGMTHFERGTPGAAHAVAVDVDPGRFFEHFFGVF